MRKWALSVGLDGVASGAVANPGLRRLRHKGQRAGKAQLTRKMELEPALAAARRRQGPARIAASGLILAALLLIAAPATADSLAELGIDPIWFPTGGENTGIGSLYAPDDFVDPSYRFLCAGGGIFTVNSEACEGKLEYELRVISQVLQSPIQFPQLDGQEPSMENPLVVDSVWTVRNDTEDILLDVLLGFTKVILEEFPGSQVPGGYPDLVNSDPTAPSSSAPASAFGMDVDFVDIIEYSPDQIDYYYFGGVYLGDLGPGETAELTVRYIVNNGPMPVIDSTVILPPLGLVGAVVPEPSTALLLGSGLLGLAAAGRRRS